jgi:hypothetical protein
LLPLADAWLIAVVVQSLRSLNRSVMRQPPCSMSRIGTFHRAVASSSPSRGSCSYSRYSIHHEGTKDRGRDAERRAMTHLQGDAVDDDGSRMREVCEDCGGVMKLRHIVPDAPGHEIRTLRCAACDAEKIQRFKIG